MDDREDTPVAKNSFFLVVIFGYNCRGIQNRETQK